MSSVLRPRGPVEWLAVLAFRFAVRVLGPERVAKSILDVDIIHDVAESPSTATMEGIERARGTPFCGTPILYEHADPPIADGNQQAP